MSETPTRYKCQHDYGQWRSTPCQFGCNDEAGGTPLPTIELDVPATAEERAALLAATPSPRSSEAGWDEVWWEAQAALSEIKLLVPLVETTTGPKAGYAGIVERVRCHVQLLREMTAARDLWKQYADANVARTQELSASLTALQQRDAALREYIKTVRSAGAQLANCAYNLAQSDIVGADRKASLRQAYERWDAIPPAASPVEGERPASRSDVTVREALLCDEEVM